MFHGQFEAACHKRETTNKTFRFSTPIFWKLLRRKIERFEIKYFMLKINGQKSVLTDNTN